MRQFIQNGAWYASYLSRIDSQKISTRKGKPTSIGSELHNLALLHTQNNLSKMRNYGTQRQIDLWPCVH